MSILILKLPEPEALRADSVIPWARVRPRGGVEARGELSLTALAGQLRAGDRIWVVLPGERVVLHAVEIPARSRSAQLQALPYALEERLSEDLDTLHIVPGPRRSDGCLVAAVVSQVDMDQWLGPLSAAGIQPTVAVPDTLLLPSVAADQSCVRICGQRVFVQHGEQEPLVLPVDLLPWWLLLPADAPSAKEPRSKLQAQPRFEAGAETGAGETASGNTAAGNPVAAETAAVVTQVTAGSAAWLHAAAWFNDTAELPAALAGKVSAPVSTWDGDWLKLFLPALGSRPALNLLVGRYAPAGTGADRWRPWRFPAALAASVLLLWLAGALLAIWQMEREAVTVDRLIDDLFEQTLPGTRIVDPMRQFEQILATGSGRGVAGASSIAQQLLNVASHLRTTGGELRQIRADSQRLEVELDLPSIAMLDRLRTQLAETGAEVRILTAESGETGVRARLQILGGA